MKGSFNEIGIWYALRSQMPVTSNRGVLLDRDGVLIAERNYLHKPEEVELIPSISDLVGAAHRMGFSVAVITNQSGIDRGIFKWKDFFAVENEIDRQLSAFGEAVDLKVACPFHPDFTPRYNSAMNYWRKPEPGMVKFACKLLGLAPEKSWMVGDKIDDIRAAKAAALAGAFFLRGLDKAKDPLAKACADKNFWVRCVDMNSPINIGAGTDRDNVSVKGMIPGQQ